MLNSLKMQIICNYKSFFPLLVSIFNCLIIYTLTYHPQHINLINFLAYLIPILLIINSLLLLFFIYKKRFCYASIIGITLIICHKPIQETFSIQYFFNSFNTKPTPTYKVFSFNASTFNKKRNQKYVEDDSLLVTQLLSFLAREKPEILCFQEFHHNDSGKDKLIDSISAVCGTNYYYMVPFWKDYQYGYFGMIIFSKYPILKMGKIFDGGSQSFNKGIYVDVLKDTDTLRIINIHLHSMNIRINNSKDLNTNIGNIWNRLRIGSEKHKLQTDTIIQFLDSTKNTIICGDFNSIPYGSTYQRIKIKNKNSFEEAGNGFGFTLNMYPISLDSTINFITTIVSV